jgi:hypothetical protein
MCLALWQGRLLLRLEVVHGSQQATSQSLAESRLAPLPVAQNLSILQAQWKQALQQLAWHGQQQRQPRI